MKWLHEWLITWEQILIRLFQYIGFMSTGKYNQNFQEEYGLYSKSVQLNQKLLLMEPIYQSVIYKTDSMRHRFKSRIKDSFLISDIISDVREFCTKRYQLLQ